MKTLPALPAFLFLLPASLFAQGPLPPPAGAPAPTMKSLDQIEPRVVLPGGTSTVVISASGSYRLAGNVAVSTGDGIQITADNVSLDLGGFTVSSAKPPPNAGAGVMLVGARSNVVIENGSIVSGVVYSGGGTFAGPGFAFGILAGSIPSAVRVTNVNVRGVSNTSISLGSGSNSLVQGCVVDTAESYGIRAGAVSDSSAFNIGTGGPAIQAASVANSTGTLTDGSAAPVITASSPSTASLSTQIADLGAALSANPAESRTLIPAGSGSFTISTSGSYVLAGDRTSPNAGAAAILVNAADVTIDLNGFTITAGVATAQGIRSSSGARRLTVRNGTIVGCEVAVGVLSAGLQSLRVENLRALDCTGAVIQGPAFPNPSFVTDCTIRGVAATTHGLNLANATVRGTQLAMAGGAGIVVVGSYAVVVECTVAGTSSSGILTGGAAVIDRCVVTGMTGDAAGAAISVGGASRVSHSIARVNTVTFGIRVGGGSTVLNCVASENTSATLAESGGIYADIRSLVVDCNASSNISSVVGQKNGFGIYALEASTIQRCVTSGNRGAGIYANGSGALILENTSSFNTRAGVVAAARKIRVEGNLATFNGTGFLIDDVVPTPLNIVVRNTAGSNTTNWDVHAGNAVAPVVATAGGAAFTGNTGGAALGSTDPNANFTLP